MLRWSEPLLRLDRVDTLLSSRLARWLGLLGVLLLAGGMRWIYHDQVSRTHGYAQPMVDEKDYDRQARGILEGSWPEPDEVFFVDPLYAFALAGLYAALGTEPETVIVAQLVLGTFSVGLLYLLAASFLRPTEALLAGVLAATYGVFFFFEGLVLKTSLALFLLHATLLAVVRARHGPLWLSGVAGLLLGLAALTRGNLLVLAPVLFFWLLASGERGRARWKRPLLLTLGTLAALAPVTLHNVRAGDLVLTTSNLGANLYTGNGPHNVTGSYVPPPGVRASPVYEQEDFHRLAERAEGRALRPSEASAHWVRRTVEEAREDRARVLALLKRKALLAVNAVEVPDNESYAKTRDRVPLLQAPLPCFGVLLIFAAGAIVLLRWRAEHVLMLSVSLTVGLTLVAFFVNARFRLGVVPGLLLLAASLPGGIAEGLARGAWGRGALSALFACLALWVTRLEVYEGTGSMLLYNDAVIAVDQEDRQAALGFLDEALEADDANWRAHTLRGLVLDELGRGEEAEDALRAGTRTGPQELEAWRELAGFLTRAGRLEEAASALERGLARSPGDPGTTVELADLERRLRRTDEARARLEELLTERPRLGRAHFVLGLLQREERDFEAATRSLREAARIRRDSVPFRLELARTLRLAGRPEEAVSVYDEVLALDPGNAEATRGRAAVSSD